MYSESEFSDVTFSCPRENFPSPVAPFHSPIHFQPGQGTAMLKIWTADFHPLPGLIGAIPNIILSQYDTIRAKKGSWVPKQELRFQKTISVPFSRFSVLRTEHPKQEICVHSEGPDITCHSCIIILNER